jgi:ketosteroid isomerase-like protein
MSSVLEEKDAIRELIARYCFLFDLGRFDEWAETFAEDAVFEVQGMFKFEGRESIREFTKHVPKNAAGLPGMKHCTLNHMIEVEGERATASCYLLLVREGTPLHVDIAGRYEDELVKRSGRWLFARRTALFDYRSGSG